MPFAPTVGVPGADEEADDAALVVAVGINVDDDNAAADVSSPETATVESVEKAMPEAD